MPDYEEMSDAELKEVLEERELSTEGSRDELIARLELDDYNEDDAEDEAQEEADSRTVPQVIEAVESGELTGEEASDLEASRTRGERKGVMEFLEGHEDEEEDDEEVVPVRRVRGSTPQERRDTPLQNFARLPDGRHVPLETDEDDEDEDEDEDDD